MSKALGLIETRGLVAAIEAADAMVKAANVTIIGKEITRPALVTIKVTGDVAAVKSAVDAGEAAARKVGEVISIHVIPQPDDQVLSILPEISYPEVESDPVNNSEVTSSEGSETKDQVTDSDLPVDDSSNDTNSGIFENDNQVSSLSINTPSIPETIIPKKQRIKKSVNTIIKKEVEILPDANPSVPEFFGTLFENSNDTISRLRKEALLAEEPSNIEEPEKVEQPEEEKKHVQSSNEFDKLNVHQLRHLARGTENFPLKGREISKANRQDLINLLTNL